MGIGQIKNRDIKPVVGQQRDMVFILHDYQSSGKRATLHDPIKEEDELADSYTCMADKGVVIKSANRGKFFEAVLVGQKNGMWLIKEFKLLEEM